MILIQFTLKIFQRNVRTMRNLKSNRLMILFFWLILSVVTFTLSDAQVCKNDGDTVCAAVDNADDVEENEVADSIQRLIDWVREKGGFIHPSLRVGYSYLRDNEYDRPSYSFGIFVKHGEETIKEGETLFSIPAEIMIQVAREAHADDVSEVVCLLADQLAFERFYNRQKEQGQGDGNGSAYEPYINFLEKFVVDHTNVPGAWSDMGESYLTAIFKDDPFFCPNFQDYYRCLEFDVFGEGNDYRHANDPMMNDEGYWDEILEVAFAHGLPYNKLIPVFDLIQHSTDPRKRNVEVKPESIQINSTVNWEVVASRDIHATEELRYSKYTRGTGENSMNKHTKDIFMNLGVVDDYPQTWVWEAHGLAVAIDRKTGSTNEEEEDTEPDLEMHLVLGEVPDDDTVYFLQTELNVWNQWHDGVVAARVDEDEADENDEDLMLAQEKELLLQYIAAYLNAIQMVLDMVTTHRQSSNETEYQVHEEKVVINTLDGAYFHQYQCNTLIQRVFDKDFDTIEHFRSAYQQINYYRDPDTGDVCLYLDGVYQQCVVSPLLLF